MTNKGPVMLLTGYQIPAAIRHTGVKRLETWLRNRKVKGAVALARTAVEAAHAQHTALPGEQLAAAMVACLAKVVMALDEEIAELDGLIEVRFSEHPHAEVIRSLPGMGARLGAEFTVGHTRNPWALRSYERPDQTHVEGRTALRSLQVVGYSTTTLPHALKRKVSPEINAESFVSVHSLPPGMSWIQRSPAALTLDLSTLETQFLVTATLRTMTLATCGTPRLTDGASAKGPRTRKRPPPRTCPADHVRSQMVRAAAVAVPR